MKHSILTITALSLGLSLSGCAGVPTNRSMNSVHVPVVEREDFMIDLATGNGGIPFNEQERLIGWFDSLKLRYGDSVTLVDPMQSPTTQSTVEALVAGYGLRMAHATSANVGFVEAGTTRVILTRTRAVVPGCPDWKARSDANPGNALSTNYGCATNSNLAAMVANPEHLVRGDDSGGDTTVMTSNKAITAFRAKAPTGAEALKSTDTKGQ